MFRSTFSKTIPAVFGAQAAATVAFDKTALYGWWDFENNELDQSGNGNNFASGDPHYNAGGKVGATSDHNNALWNAQRTAPNSPTLQAGDNDWTFCAWCYPADTSTCSIGGKYGGGGHEWLAAFSGGTEVLARVVATDVSDSVQADFSIAYSINTWYFVRFWYTAADKKIRVDVNESGTPAVSSAASFTPIAGTSDFVVGKLGDASPNFTGRIDSVAWFKRLLTTAEGLYLYNAGAGRNYSQL